MTVDTTRAIIYRSFILNDASIEDDIDGGGAIGTGITGSVVDSMDPSDVDIVQFMEKRSQADGMDVGPVEKGARRIRVSGTLYGKTRPELYDLIDDFKAALDPVLAMREEPGDKGYRPLYFSRPTNRVTEFTNPEGIIDLMVRAMPRASQVVVNRDAQGGSDTDSLAVPWQATFLCRDPGIYGATPIDVAFTATSNFANTTTGAEATDLFTTGAVHGLVAGDRITFSSITGGTGLSTGTAYYIISSGLTTTAFKVSLTSGGSAVNFTTDVTAATWVKSSTASGNWTNRGSYLGRFNAVIEVGAGAGSIVATVGDGTFTVTLPASTGNRIIRIKDDKVITVEEDNVEVPRPNYLTFSNDTTWPLIDPEESAYSVTFHGMSGVVDGSHMWFYEQYAG